MATLSAQSSLVRGVPQLCSSSASRAAVLGGVGGTVFAVEVLEGYSQMNNTGGQITSQNPLPPATPCIAGRHTQGGRTTSKVKMLTNYS